MEGIFESCNISFLSFDPDGFQTSYTHSEIEQKIVKKLRYTIEKLEMIPQVILCARGDSRTTIEKHNEFINKDLAKLFIVGEKAKNYFKPKSSKKLRHYKNPAESNNDLKGELKSLIETVNEIIQRKPELRNITGIIPNKCIDAILEQDLTKLQEWKVFFLSFLHNAGSMEEFKSSSPFLSLTYGNGKMDIAKKFAIERCKHDYGIVFIYSLTSNFPYYVMAKDLTDQLKRYGVNWYEDKNHEILLLNGMYPHFLIGILEISKVESLKFILNPWLFKQFKDGKEFNYTEGIRIDQTYFYEFAGKLGYKRWFFHITRRPEEFISDLNEFNPGLIYRTPQFIDKR